MFNVAEKVMLAVKSFVVGASMMIPGVSGGSMAMILGEYDRLIGAVPALFARNERKGAFAYLAVFAVFGLLGILIAARPLEWLTTRFSVTVMYFFLGAVIGTIPMMFRKARAQKFDFPSIIYIAVGIAIVFSIDFIPENAIDLSVESGALSLLSQFLVGIVVSIGLILPGISTTYLLLVLGLYEPVLAALSSRNFLSLVPICAGGLAGILCLTKLLQVAMRDHPKPSFMMILGFLLGSLREVYPGLPAGAGIPVSIVLLIAGFIIVYKLSSLEDAKDAAEQAAKAGR